MKRVLKTWPWLLVIMALMGCQEEYQVTLASENETIAQASFAIDDMDKNRITSVHTIRVYNQREALVWHLRRDTLAVDTGLNGFQYGATPRGFEVVVRPVPLEASAAYTVVVQGRGYGLLRFAVNSSGQLVPLGNKPSGF